MLKTPSRKKNRLLILLSIPFAMPLRRCCSIDMGGAHTNKVVAIDCIVQMQSSSHNIQLRELKYLITNLPNYLLVTRHGCNT